MTEPPLVDATQGEDIGPAEDSRRRSAVRGGVWSALSQVIPALGTAVLSVAAGRYLGSAKLGQQSLIAYVNAAVAFVVVTSLNTAVLQAAGRLHGAGDARTGRVLSLWAIRAHIAGGVLTLAIMFGAGLVVGNNVLSWALIGGVSVLDGATDGLSIRLILAEGWAPLGKLRLIFQMLGPLLGLAFLFAGFGIAGIFLGDGLAALGLLFPVIGRYRRLNRIEPDPFAPPSRRPRPFPRQHDAAPSKPHIGVRPPVPVARTYALFGVGGLITQIVSKRVEFIVLAAFAGDTAIGMYSVAFMAVNLLTMVPTGIAVAAMPLVAAAEARGEADAANRHLALALRMGTAVSIPLTAILAALGPTSVLLVYGTAYDSASRLVPLASVSLLVAVIGGVCSQFWAGRNRLAIVLGTGGVAALVDLVMALALVPSLGSTGAALANIGGQFALAAGLLGATVRETGPIGWRLRSLLAFTVSGAVGAGAGLLVKLGVDHLLPDGVEVSALTTLVLGSVVAVVVVVAVALLIKLFDEEEAEWVRPLVPSRLHGLLTRLTVVHAGG